MKPSQKTLDRMLSRGFYVVRYFGTTGKVYESRFWAKRTNEDTLWWANLCQECQTKVKDFINENKTSEAVGVKEIYQDPMGG